MTARAALRFAPPLTAEDTAGRSAIVSLATDQANQPIVAIAHCGEKHRRGRKALFVLGGPLGASSLASLGWLTDAAALGGRVELVFLDPPGTGFSPLSGNGVLALKRDAALMADAIADYMNRHGADITGVHLLGHGYGGLRTVAVADQLRSSYPGVEPASLVLSQTVLNTVLVAPCPDTAIATAMRLPELVARDHDPRQGSIPHDLLAAAEDAAYDELLPALLKGDQLPAADRERLAATLAERFGAASAELLTTPATCQEVWPQAPLTVSPQAMRFLDRFGSEIAQDYVPVHEEIADRWDWSTGESVGDFYSVDLKPMLGELLDAWPRLRVLSLLDVLDPVTPYLAARAPAHPLIREHLVVAAGVASPTAKSGHIARWLETVSA